MTQDDADRGRPIGTIAEATGLTVRTLHYYEEIGLLAPERTEAGHRRYAEADVARLYRVCLLRRLGLPLAEIRDALDDPGWELGSAVSAHLGALDQRLAAEHLLRDRLARLAATVDGDGAPPADDLLQVLEEMIMLDATVQRRISILVYDDLEAANEFLIRVFGLGAGEITRDGDGNIVHVELQAGDGVLWLHPATPEFGLASPRTLGGASATMAIMVDDVDAHHRHAVEEGATIDYAPVDQPYGYREYSARDLEGGLWSFMKPLD